MIKKVSIFCLALIVFYFFFGCADNDDPNDLKNTSCNVSQDYHFKGSVNGLIKSFVAGSKNYQRYGHSEVEGSEAPKGLFVFGINTWPLSIGDESIFMYTPKVNTTDPADIALAFPLGELSASQRKEFRVLYKVLLDVDNYRTNTLEGKFDADSSIQICNIESVAGLGTNTQLRVRMIFSCKLYSLDGELKGEIENGKITGLIHVANGQ